MNNIFTFSEFVNDSEITSSEITFSVYIAQIKYQRKNIKKFQKLINLNQTIQLL